MKEELVKDLEKINKLPAELTWVEERKKRLIDLVNDKKGITINGPDDKEGRKVVTASRIEIKNERCEITNKVKEVKSTIKKFTDYFVNGDNECKEIALAEEKKFSEMEALQDRQIKERQEAIEKEQKEKLKERLRMIHELNPDTDGYTHSLSFEGEEMSINNDEIEMIVDEQFHNFYFNMGELSKKIKDQKRIEEEKSKAERERIEKEKEAERLAQKKIRLAQEKENERIRIENEKAQKELERQREEIRLAQEKVKQEAEALERERKAKEAKELAEKQALEAEEAAKKAKLKSEKEAEEKRRLDIERQKMLAPFKDEGIKAIEKSYDLGFIEDKIKNEEVQEIIDQYLEEFVLSMGMAIERIRSL